MNNYAREDRGFFLLFVALVLTFIDFVFWVIGIFDFAHYPTHLLSGSIFGAVAGFLWVIADITHFDRKDRSLPIDLMFLIYGIFSLFLIVVIVSVA